MSETHLKPRLVLVTRPTELQGLLARYSTTGQVAFFLKSRGQSYDDILRRHDLQNRAIDAVSAFVPADWSFALVEREDLNRFLFFPNDIVVALGQDGLVANLSKYLDSQPVIGVSPDPSRTEGVLTPHALPDLPRLVFETAEQTATLLARTMVQAKLASGPVLTAVNELFIGHRSHQSAKYELRFGEAGENHSSSGLIVSTGTGMTGWAKSIMTATHQDHSLTASDKRAAFFAREPWPSRTTGCALSSGEISEESGLWLRSRIDEGGVIFADGVEQDFLPFNWGEEVDIRISERVLNVVC